MRLFGSRATVAVIAVIASTGCVPDAGLLVDLRTDLLPGRQFSLVRTELSTELPDVGAQTSVELVEREASATDDYFAGARVAELTQLAPGGYWVRVTLLDDAGTRVAERLVRLDELRESRVITVVITSDCLGVVCPERLTCWNGSCVEPTCTGGDPASCGPPECEADADCPAAPACADARCVEGICLNEAHTDRCMADEYCDALSGCTLAACGDASVAPTEGCDDGSLRDGDGCSATCELEPGWSCTGEPSTCLDVLPDAFAFVDVTGASPGVEYVSNEVLATGIEAPIDAAVTGDASAVLLIDGVASGRSATVSPGDRLALRMQASPSLATTSMAALSLGGVTASWAVTTFGGSCAAGTMTFATPGTVTFVVPAGCGHVSVRMWGAGGGGGRTPCVMLDGSGGGATTISRASGELVAAAGGGGGGPAHMSAGSGAYVEASLAVTEGEVLSLVVGAPGLRNAVDGGSAGSGPYGGPIGGGGLGLGDFVVPGNPPGDLTLRTAAPFGSASGFGSGGRSDGNCTDGPTDGGRGNIELRWGP